MAITLQYKSNGNWELSSKLPEPQSKYRISVRPPTDTESVAKNPQNPVQIRNDFWRQPISPPPCRGFRQ